MIRNKQIVIIGAGGHGRVAADIAKLMGYEQIFFLDDAQIPGVVGKVSECGRYLGHADFFVAIGNNAVRERIICQLETSGAEIVSLIHPDAIISENTTIGSGTVIMAGSVVNTDTVIGRGTIINTCASVDHDCRIGDFVHVAVGAHVCGTVEIGVHTWIGAGATVINNVHICENCMIGAGAVVVREIVQPGTYMGVPAKKVE